MAFETGISIAIDPGPARRGAAEIVQALSSIKLTADDTARSLEGSFARLTSRLSTGGTGTAASTGSGGLDLGSVFSLRNRIGTSAINDFGSSIGFGELTDATLSSVLSAGGIGASVGGLLAGLTGGNSLGGSVGGGVGAAIGQAVLPGIGGFIGGGLGSLIGGLFGNSKPSVGPTVGADFNVADGRLVLVRSGVDNGASASQAEAFGKAVGDVLNRLAEAGGGRFTGVLNVGRTDRNGLEIGTLGSGVADERFGDDVLGLLRRIFLSSGIVEGLSQDFATALRNTTATDVDGALADLDFASRYRTLFDPPATLGQFESQLQALQAQFDVAKAKAESLGLEGVGAMADSFARATALLKSAAQDSWQASVDAANGQQFLTRLGGTRTQFQSTAADEAAGLLDAGSATTLQAAQISAIVNQLSAADLQSVSQRFAGKDDTVVAFAQARLQQLAQAQQDSAVAATAAALAQSDYARVQFAAAAQAKAAQDAAVAATRTQADALNAASRAQADYTQRLSEAQRVLSEYAASLPDFLLRFQTGAGSTLSPQDQVDLARQQFQAVMEAARGGDAGAIGKAQSTFETAAGTLRGAYGSGQPYEDFVTAGISALRALPAQVNPEDVVANAVRQASTDIVGAVGGTTTAVQGTTAAVNALGGNAVDSDGRRIVGGLGSIGGGGFDQLAAHDALVDTFGYYSGHPQAGFDNLGRNLSALAGYPQDNAWYRPVMTAEDLAAALHAMPATFGSVGLGYVTSATGGPLPGSAPNFAWPGSTWATGTGTTLTGDPLRAALAGSARAWSDLAGSGVFGDAQAANFANLGALYDNAAALGRYAAGGWIGPGEVGLAGETGADKPELLFRPTLVRGPAYVANPAVTARVMGAAPLAGDGGNADLRPVVQQLGRMVAVLSDKLDALTATAAEGVGEQRTTNRHIAGQRRTAHRSFG